MADGETRTTYQSDVLISDGVITCIGENIEGWQPGDRLTGTDVTAGYIDSHVLGIESSMVPPHAFGVCVLPFGTTAVIADPRGGQREGGRRTERISRRVPRNHRLMCLRWCRRVCPPPSGYQRGGEIPASDMKPFDRPWRYRGTGRGDVLLLMWLRQPLKSWIKIRLFKDKTIDGHIGGNARNCWRVRQSRVWTIDHECSDAHLMMERYRKGDEYIYVEEVPPVTPVNFGGVKENALDVSRFAFCTDDKHLATIQEEGHISYIVGDGLRRLGFSWGEVAGMASYNPLPLYRLKTAETSRRTI